MCYIDDEWDDVDTLMNMDDDEYDDYRENYYDLQDEWDDEDIDELLDTIDDYDSCEEDYDKVYDVDNSDVDDLDLLKEETKNYIDDERGDY